MGKAPVWLRRTVIIGSWLLLWQLVSLAVDNELLLVGPVETARAFLEQMCRITFWRTVGWSVARIGLGFLAGTALGLALAAVGARLRMAEEFFAPALMLLKAVPVASIAVLLLIWWGSSFLSVAVSFLIVLPGVYLNTLEGLKSMDRRLSEMAEVFRVPFRNRFFYIIRPSLKPFLDSSLKLAAGMAWKSGVAAEVIGTPDFSVGERLYMSKISLDTAGVFAWTAAVILLSFLSERLVLLLWQRFSLWEPACRPPRPLGPRTDASPVSADPAPAVPVSAALPPEKRLDDGPGLLHVYKSFDGQPVLQDFSEIYASGEISRLTWPSGAGKTTALRLLAGLEKPDGGQVRTVKPCAVLFQEDRLCEAYSAVRNVELVTGEREKARRQLLELLPEECLDKPCGQLSGGQKRRVAVVRAMAAEAEILLLDEPFSGLDAENGRLTRDYILRERRGRTIVMATHTKHL